MSSASRGSWWFTLLWCCACLMGGCVVNPVPTPEKSTAYVPLDDAAGESLDNAGGGQGSVDSGASGSDASPTGAADDAALAQDSSPTGDAGEAGDLGGPGDLGGGSGSGDGGDGLQTAQD